MAMVGSILGKGAIHDILRDAQEQSAARKAELSNSSALPAVTYNSKKPDVTLGQITLRDQARYEQDYIPVEDRAINSLDDMSIIEDAKKRVSDTSGLRRTSARAEREARRYGFKRSRAAVTNADIQGVLDKTKSDADTLNEARLNQFDRNRGFRNELINIGRGVSEQAVSGLTDAAGLKTQRDNINRANSAAASAQRTQMLGSAAALAIFMM